MKRIFLLCLFVLSLASCSVGSDDSEDFYFEFLPIESVEMPNEFILGQIYEIHLTYLRPSNCYDFYDLYYAHNSNQRTVAVVNTVYPNRNCETLENEEVDIHFDFLASRTDSYVFKFWQGKDENGNDMYYIVEVPVIE